MCQKQASWAGIGNYIPTSQWLWDVITCLCSSYLLLTQKSSYNDICNVKIFIVRIKSIRTTSKWLNESLSFCAQTKTDLVEEYIRFVYITSTHANRPYKQCFLCLLIHHIIIAVNESSADDCCRYRLELHLWITMSRRHHYFSQQVTSPRRCIHRTVTPSHPALLWLYSDATGLAKSWQLGFLFQAWFNLDQGMLE